MLSILVRIFILIEENNLFYFSLDFSTLPCVELSISPLSSSQKNRTLVSIFFGTLTAHGDMVDFFVNMLT